MMMLFKREPVEVLNTLGTLSQIVEGGYDPIWVPTLRLKPLPIPKKSDVERALEANPAALDEFAKLFKQGGRIEISCQPSKISQLAQQLSATSCMTEIEATDFIQPTTERSHMAKFDILMPHPPQYLVDSLGVFFDFKGHRARKGEVQINSRPLAEWLMKNHDVLPALSSYADEETRDALEEFYHTEEQYLRLIEEEGHSFFVGEEEEKEEGAIDSQYA